jgi:hypothetical protein
MQQGDPVTGDSNASPVLVVLAAGMSTRFGAVKPLAAVGPNDETLLDYVMYDAARSGYGSAVFVVRPEIEEAVSRHVESLTSGSWPCRFVYQRLDDLPEGSSPPPNRSKPWGTGHAVWSTRDAVTGPFAVVNADDFYGQAALALLPQYFPELGLQEFLAISYRLTDTLPESAPVSRGILDLDDSSYVREIREVLRVCRSDSGISGRTPADTPVSLTGDEGVSMGLWGFTPDIYPLLERGIRTLVNGPAQDAAVEYYLSEALNDSIASGEASLRAVDSGLPSFGVTFPNDRPVVQARINHMIEKGHYPADLCTAFKALSSGDTSSVGQG